MFVLTRLFSRIFREIAICNSNVFTRKTKFFQRSSNNFLLVIYEAFRRLDRQCHHQWIINSSLASPKLADRAIVSWFPTYHAIWVSSVSVPWLRLAAMYAPSMSTKMELLSWSLPTQQELKISYGLITEKSLIDHW